MGKNWFQNAELDGSAFELEGGPIGVLLLHGLTATTTEVRWLAESLHKHGFAVSAPLLPGHNTSPQDLNHRTWQEWVDCAEQAYQYLVRQKTVVFVGGESTGALLSLWLAAKYPRLDGLLLFAPALIIPGINRTRWYSWIKPYRKKKQGTRTMPWKGYTVNPLRAIYQLSLLQQAVRPLLGQVHQPAIIFQGMLDKTIDPISAQVVYDEIQSEKKSLYWMEDSTHCVLIDQEFDIVEQRCLAFLKSILTKEGQSTTLGVKLDYN